MGEHNPTLKEWKEDNDAHDVTKSTHVFEDGSVAIYILNPLKVDWMKVASDAVELVATNMLVGLFDADDDEAERVHDIIKRVIYND